MRIATLGLALALTSAASFAHAFNTEDMHSGMTMLEAQARLAFTEFGIEADPMKLTLEQLVQVSSALEAQNSEAEMQDALKKIVEK